MEKSQHDFCITLFLAVNMGWDGKITRIADPWCLASNSLREDEALTGDKFAAQ
jgi:hypothetical protein